MKTKVGYYDLFGEPRMEVVRIEGEMVTWKFMNERTERQTTEENFRNGIARRRKFVARSPEKKNG